MIELTLLAPPHLLTAPSVHVVACRFRTDPAGAAGLVVPEGEVAPILPAALSRAVLKRQAEFLAGRLAAAVALRHLGFPTDLPVAMDRSPQWPAGIVGSISHTDQLAIVVVAPSSCYGAVGIDIEPMMDAETAVNLCDMIAQPAEQALRPERWSMARFLTVLFSAKEALYKAIYPSLRTVLEFHDAQLLQISEAKLTLALSPRAGIQAGQAHFDVSYWFSGELCHSWLYVPVIRRADDWRSG